MELKTKSIKNFLNFTWKDKNVQILHLKKLIIAKN